MGLTTNFKKMKRYFIIGLSLLISSFTFAQKTLKIGIISDFAANEARAKYVNEKLIAEIQKTVGSFIVIESDANILFSEYDINKAQNNYRELTQRCDLIILIGAVSIKGGLKFKKYPIPTIAIGVISPEIQRVPYTGNGTSGIKNFTYILTSQKAEEELEEFRKIVPINNLTILFDSKTAAAVNDELYKKRKHLSDYFDSKINIVAVNRDDMVSSLKKIPEDSDAVFVAIPFELIEEDIQQISKYLNQNKIPSFSMNRWHVDAGILACLSSNNGFDQIIRKTAIMVDGAIRGELLADMPVAINTRKELSLNMATAKKIGFSPTFETLFTANLLNDEEQLSSKTYSLESIIGKALETNLNIQISQKDIKYSQQEIKNAKSQFLPDVNLSATAVQIDKDRTSPIVGQSEKTLSGTGTFQQLIYSEQAMGNIKIQKYLNEAQKYATQQEINNIILDCFIAYFNILQTKTNVLIQKENYVASKRNLELAQIRVRLGSSNNADVYRWKSEVARANQFLVEAKSNELLAHAQLNNLLDNSLEINFRVADVLLENNIFERYKKSFGEQYFNTPEKLKRMMGFLIAETQQNHPAKKQLNANSNAIDRQQQMNKRAYYTPTIAIKTQADNVWWRGGKDSSPAPGTSYNNLGWNVGLNISYPLFNGNRRRINLAKTKIQREQIELQNTRLDNDLDLNIKAKTLQLIFTSTNLRFSKISSENAEKNFELVQENYKQGLVSITQLIDAQKAALQAKQAYAFSVYEYLISQTQIEHAIGFFSILSTPGDLIQFNKRLKQTIVK